jgi:hypothetical protein
MISSALSSTAFISRRELGLVLAILERDVRADAPPELVGERRILKDARLPWASSTFRVTTSCATSGGFGSTCRISLTLAYASTPPEQDEQAPTVAKARPSCETATSRGARMHY